VDHTGYFGQVQVSVTEQLFLTGGIRAERNPNFGADYGTAWSPRVGAAYVLGLGPASVKLRASYGESIRAPQPGQRDASGTPYTIQVANPALAPERQRGADAGVEVYMGRASFVVTYYNQRAINLIDFVSVPRPPGDTLPAFQYQNVSRVKNTGGSWRGGSRLGPCSWRAPTRSCTAPSGSFRPATTATIRWGIKSWGLLTRLRVLP